MTDRPRPPRRPRTKRQPPVLADEQGWLDPVQVAESQWRSAGWYGGPRILAALSVLRVEELIRTSNMAVLRKHRLTHARHAVLALLYFSPEGQLPMSKLSRRLMVHPTSITATVDALERLQYVERVPHPSDRRTTLATLTATGRKAVEETSTAMARSDFGLAALSDEESLELYRLLAKVRAAWGEIRPAGHHGAGSPEDVASTFRRG